MIRIQDEGFMETLFRLIWVSFLVTLRSLELIFENLFLKKASVSRLMMGNQR